MRKLNLSPAVPAALALLLLIAPGCTPLTRLNLNIQSTEPAARLNIPVYVGWANLPQKTGLWEDKAEANLEDLRRSSPAARHDLILFQLAAAGTNITTRAPIWEIWRNQKRADTVVIIADLPQNLAGPGSDQRRGVIPLQKKRWPNLPKKTVNVLIHPDKVELLTPPGQ